MQGKLPEAERQFREAIRFKPDHAGAQSNLGNALGAQNKLEEAIPHYQKALEIDPERLPDPFQPGAVPAAAGAAGRSQGPFHWRRCACTRIIRKRRKPWPSSTPARSKSGRSADILVRSRVRAPRDVGCAHAGSLPTLLRTGMSGLLTRSTPPLQFPALPLPLASTG